MKCMGGCGKKGRVVQLGKVCARLCGECEGFVRQGRALLSVRLEHEVGRKVDVKF